MNAQVLHASLKFFGRDGPIPSPRSLAIILIACRHLKLSGFPHEVWRQMVVPALHKKRLSKVPRILTSAYIRGALECDLRLEGINCMTDCMGQSSNTWKALTNIWDSGGGGGGLGAHHMIQSFRTCLFVCFLSISELCLPAGPLLTASDLIVLVQEAKNTEDMDLLLNSSLGRWREQAGKRVIGYVPSIFTKDMIWEGSKIVPHKLSFATLRGLLSGYISCTINFSTLSTISSLFTAHVLHSRIHTVWS